MPTSAFCIVAHENTKIHILFVNESSTPIVRNTFVFL